MKAVARSTKSLGRATSRPAIGFPVKLTRWMLTIPSDGWESIFASTLLCAGFVIWQVVPPRLSSAEVICSWEMSCPPKLCRRPLPTAASPSVPGSFRASAAESGFPSSSRLSPTNRSRPPASR